MRVVIVGVALALLGAPEASAEYYFTKRGAERIARDFVARQYDYDYADVLTACRPQGLKRGDPAYKYHRWTCGWVTHSDTCGGRVLIIGSRGRGAYYGRVVNGMTCY